MYDPDRFDCSGFADFIHDAAVLVLFCLLLLAISSPWWLP